MRALVYKSILGPYRSSKLFVRIPMVVHKPAWEIDGVSCRVNSNQWMVKHDLEVAGIRWLGCICKCQERRAGKTCALQSISVNLKLPTYILVCKSLFIF